MNEEIRLWLEELYKKEIEEVKGTIGNERLWELGYTGDEPNPHTENIAVLNEYMEVLAELLSKVNQ